MSAVLTYHALGFYGLPAFVAAGILLRVLPPGSDAHRLIARAALAALVLIAAIVIASY